MLSKPLHKPPEPTLPRSSSRATQCEPPNTRIVYTSRLYYFFGKKAALPKSVEGNSCTRPDNIDQELKPIRSSSPANDESFNPASEAFRKYSATLHTVIQDPEDLAWNLYAKDVITSAVRDSAIDVTQPKRSRISSLLVAVESEISVKPKVFDVFLSVLATRSSMRELCGKIDKARCEISGLSQGSTAEAHMVTAQFNQEDNGEESSYNPESDTRHTNRQSSSTCTQFIYTSSRPSRPSLVTSSLPPAKPEEMTTDQQSLMSNLCGRVNDVYGKPVGY